jgi:hypothetical protein
LFERQTTSLSKQFRVALNSNFGVVASRKTTIDGIGKSRMEEERLVLAYELLLFTAGVEGTLLLNQISKAKG